MAKNTDAAKKAADQRSPTSRGSGKTPTSRVVSVGKGIAPLTFVGDLADIVHQTECRYFNAKSVAAVVSDVHSTRAFCSCMSSFQLDKQFALEVQARDMTVDAYALVLTMIRTYGLPAVIADDNLFTIIARYDFLSKLYQQISPSISWASPPVLPLLHEAMDGSSQDYTPIFDARLQRARQFLNHLDDFDKGDFKVMVEEPGVCRVLMRTHPTDSRKASFRLDGYLDASLSGVVSLISEVEMANQWAPYFKFPIKVGLKRSMCFEREGRMDKSSVYEIELPWPMTNRDAAVHGYMVDDLERNGRLAFCIQSLDMDYPIDDALYPPNMPKPESGFCRITMEGGCLLTPIGPNKVLMENLWNIDLKESVPTFLLNFVGGTFIKSGFHSFNRFCRQVDTDAQWKSAREKDPWLYRYIESRMEQLKSGGVDVVRIANSSRPSVRSPTATTPRVNGVNGEKLRKAKMKHTTEEEDLVVFLQQLSTPVQQPIALVTSTLKSAVNAKEV